MTRSVQQARADLSSAFASIAVWMVMLLLFVMCASLVPPVEVVVRMAPNPAYLHVLLGLPGVVAFVVFCGRPLYGVVVGQSKESFDPAVAMYALIVYCLYVILITGGVYRSAFAPCIGMVVLVAARFLGDKRKWMLVLAAVGVVVVGILSALFRTDFTVAPNLPPEWKNVGIGGAFVAYALVATSLLLEVGVYNSVNKALLEQETSV